MNEEIDQNEEKMIAMEHETNKKMTSKDAVSGSKILKSLAPPNTEIRGWDESSEMESGAGPG